MKSKNILIIILSIITLLIVYLMIKYNILGQIQKNIEDKTQKMEENTLSYIIYDNTGEKLKTVVTIAKEEGIDSVEYTDNDGKIVKIEGQGNKRIAIDLKATVDVDIPFKIVSNELETTEVMHIPTDYIEKYMITTKLEEESTETAHKYNIEYNTDLVNENVKNYYKVGNDNEKWIEYSNKMQIELADLDNPENKTTTLYTKEVNQYNDTLIKQEIVNVPLKGDVDIFKQTTRKGKSLSQSGFTSSYSHSEDSGFSLNYLKAGHHRDSADYSGTFRVKWDTLKLNMFKAPQLYIEYRLFANTRYGCPSNVGFTTTVRYKDGTTTSGNKGATQYQSETSVPVTLNLDKTKDIDYLEMKVYGYDDNNSYSYGYVRNIILKGIEI